MKGWLVITSHVWHQSFWGLKKPTKWWQICQVYKIYPHRNLNPWFHKLHHQLHCLCTISTKLVLMQPKLDVNDFNCRSQSERSSYKRKQRTSLICISIYSLLLSIFIIPSEDGRLMDRWSWEEGRDRLIIQQDFPEQPRWHNMHTQMTRSIFPMCWLLSINLWPAAASAKGRYL